MTERISFVEAMALAEHGLERWKAKEHNAKWWRKIDGTPIPNDLLVNIAEEFAKCGLVYASEGAAQQDPEAWMREDGSAATVNPMIAASWKGQGAGCVPLYTSPLISVPAQPTVDKKRLMDLAEEIEDSYQSGPFVKDLILLEGERRMIVSALHALAGRPATTHRCVCGGGPNLGHAEECEARTPEEAGFFPAQPPAAPVETVKPQDHSVPVLIEALYRCGCPVAGNMTIGECAETEQCGCSIQAARLKGCMGEEHQRSSADSREVKKPDFTTRLSGERETLEVYGWPLPPEGSEAGGKPNGCEPCNWPECGCQNCPASADNVDPEAWMREDGSAATVNPMIAAGWKGQGHTIVPLYRVQPQPVPLMDAGSIFTFLRERMEGETSASLAVACRALADHLRVLRAVPQQSSKTAAPEPHRWPSKGDRMTFLGKNGYDFERERALTMFRVGDEYTVEDCDVGNWSHSVKFEGVDGWHNGVMFELTSPLSRPHGGGDK